MSWKQRHPEIKTIRELVEMQTGISAEELLNDTKNYRVKGLDKVKEKLAECRDNDIFVTVVGDYDCDGFTSSAIMDKLLGYLKIRHKIRIPHRHTEGYGLKPSIIDEIDEGVVFTVDNGIVAFDAIEKAKKKGLYVIVTDHHQKAASGELPNADIIIDPAALPGTADFSGYCGAGIALKLAQEILPEGSPLLKKLTTIAMIGTVADVVKLVGDNRKIVKEGLENFCATGGCTMGLCSLKREMNLGMGVTSTDIAFSIAPALNAASRLEGTTISCVSDESGNEEDITADAMMSFDILAKAFGSWDESDRMARQIKEINAERKDIKRFQYNLVKDYIMKNAMENDAPIVVYLPTLHLGIIGILAGSIVENFGVPAIVFTNDSNNPELLKGSARSVEEVNMKELLDKHADDIVAYGGHAGAAGLTIRRDMLEKFRNDLNESLMDKMFDKPVPSYDFEITEEEIPEYIEELKKYAPYGEGNPEPMFLIRGYKLFPSYGQLFRYVGEEHVVMQGKSSKATAFFLREQFDALDNPKVIDIIGTIGEDYDRYGNVTPVFHIKALRDSTVIPIKKTGSLFDRLSKTVNNEEEIAI